jgi:hypothetical protein
MEEHMRRAGVVVVMVLAGLLVTACDKRQGLLAEQRAADGPPAASSRAAAPSQVPAWRLADIPQTTPTSVLWDVVATDEAHAWAVGNESYDPATPGSDGVPIVQHWDGTTWSPQELAGIAWRGGLRLVAADGPDNVWAVGGTAGADPAHTTTHVLHYDGTAWTEVPFPPGNKPSNTHVTDLAVAGGHTWLIGDQGGKVLVHEFDGQGWQQRTPPNECTKGGVSFGGMPNFCNFTGIVAFAADDAWVAGNAAWSGFKGPLLFHWDGTAWTPVKVGLNNVETAFSEIAGTPGDIWAVGHTAGYGGPVAVHGDGKTWRPVEGLPTARLTDLVVDRSGRPWVLENFTAPSATLATYRDERWADTRAPTPPDVVGISLHGITTVPGTTEMFAVGDVDLPGEPRKLSAVLLVYR